MRDGKRRVRGYWANSGFNQEKEVRVGVDGQLSAGILALGFVLGWLARTDIVKAGPNVLGRRG